MPLKSVVRNVKRIFFNLTSKQMMLVAFFLQYQGWTYGLKLIILFAQTQRECKKLVLKCENLFNLP